MARSRLGCSTKAGLLMWAAQPTRSSQWHDQVARRPRNKLVPTNGKWEVGWMPFVNNQQIGLDVNTPRLLFNGTIKIGLLNQDWAANVGCSTNQVKPMARSSRTAAKEQAGANKWQVGGWAGLLMWAAQPTRSSQWHDQVARRPRNELVPTNGKWEVGWMPFVNNQQIGLDDGLERAGVNTPRLLFNGTIKIGLLNQGWAANVGCSTNQVKPMARSSRTAAKEQAGANKWQVGDGLEHAGVNTPRLLFNGTIKIGLLNQGWAANSSFNGTIKIGLLNQDWAANVGCSTNQVKPMAQSSRTAAKEQAGANKWQVGVNTPRLLFNGTIKIGLLNQDWAANVGCSTNQVKPMARSSRTAAKEQAGANKWQVGDGLEHAGVNTPRLLFNGTIKIGLLNQGWAANVGCSTNQVKPMARSSRTAVKEQADGDEWQVGVNTPRLLFNGTIKIGLLNQGWAANVGCSTNQVKPMARSSRTAVKEQADGDEWQVGDGLEHAGVNTPQSSFNGTIKIGLLNQDWAANVGCSTNQVKPMAQSSRTAAKEQAGANKWQVGVNTPRLLFNGTIKIGLLNQGWAANSSFNGTIKIGLLNQDWAANVGCSTNQVKPMAQSSRTAAKEQAGANKWQVGDGLEHAGVNTPQSSFNGTIKIGLLNQGWAANVGCSTNQVKPMARSSRTAAKEQAGANKWQVGDGLEHAGVNTPRLLFNGTIKIGLLNQGWAANVGCSTNQVKPMARSSRTAAKEQAGANKWQVGDGLEHAGVNTPRLLFNGTIKIGLLNQGWAANVGCSTNQVKPMARSSRTAAKEQAGANKWQVGGWVDAIRQQPADWA
ncbi:hypothetical protein BC831DRAFT_508278 [Entophlyctis helioformis]|nr:hypothetical protein BC831DRAFT_508278 [Entophlyctis helioformis]